MPTSPTFLAQIAELCVPDPWISRIPVALWLSMFFQEGVAPQNYMCFRAVYSV